MRSKQTLKLYILHLKVATQSSWTSLFATDIHNSSTCKITVHQATRNPEKLVIGGTETRYQIAQRRNEHAEALRMFQEYLGGEKSAIKVNPSYSGNEVPQGTAQSNHKQDHPIHSCSI